MNMTFQHILIGHPFVTKVVIHEDDNCAYVLVYHNNSEHYSEDHYQRDLAMAFHACHQDYGIPFFKWSRIDPATIDF